MRRVKGIFSNLGYYKRPVENGIIDQEMDTAIHTFQKEKDLKIDGYMNPGGETERALINHIFNNQKKPEKTNEPVLKPETDKPNPAESKKPQKENEKTMCLNEKKRFSLAVKDVDQRRNEIKAIRQSIQAMEKEIDDIELRKIKERQSTTAARVIGGVGGAVTLGAIGAILGGPGGAAAGIGRGLASGGGGIFAAEEIADAISGTKDIDFDTAIENLRKSIEDSEKHLEDNLIPSLDEAMANLSDAQDDLKKCMGN